MAKVGVGKRKQPCYNGEPRRNRPLPIRVSGCRTRSPRVQLLTGLYPPPSHRDFWLVYEALGVARGTTKDANCPLSVAFLPTIQPRSDCRSTRDTVDRSSRFGRNVGSTPTSIASSRARGAKWSYVAGHTGGRTGSEAIYLLYNTQSQSGKGLSLLVTGLRPKRT